MNNNYLGVFDSGIGGLTVIKEIQEKLPNENIVYFGDTKNMPYGAKTKEEIEKMVIEDVKLLSTFKPKAIVIACNTSDAICGDLLNEHYNLPIVGIIEPTAQVAIKTTKNNKIGVFATSAAINSNAYQNALKKIDTSVEISAVACPSLASLVEKGLFDSEITKSDIQTYLKPIIENGCDTLILGCTHYPLLKDLIKQYAPNIELVSSSSCAATKLIETLTNLDFLASEHLDNKYFVSSDTEGFKKTATIFMDDIKKVNLI